MIYRKKKPFVDERLEKGINAQIQTIKSNGHGYLNFNRFRNRCVYVINKDVPRKVNK